jgi:uncharacterized protein YybS (DUF2232 family)
MEFVWILIIVLILDNILDFNKNLILNSLEYNLINNYKFFNFKEKNV